MASDSIHYRSVKAISRILDNQFEVFGFRFGLDPILGLIPIAGDTVSLVLSLYTVYVGLQMKLPQREINRMIGNVFVDYLIGLVPILGNVGDFFYKAASKNIKILEKYGEDIVEEGEIIKE